MLNDYIDIYKKQYQDGSPARNRVEAEHAPGLPEVLEVVLVQVAHQVDERNLAPVGVHRRPLPLHLREPPERIRRVLARVGEARDRLVDAHVLVVLREGDVVEVDVADGREGPPQDRFELLGGFPLHLAQVERDGEQTPPLVLP